MPEAAGGQARIEPIIQAFHLFSARHGVVLGVFIPTVTAGAAPLLPALGYSVCNHA
ncbi:hypothetical protein BDQ94DRAFT_149059 [Aspergillus welwitschiae]|uniref:Uncharacterized protein n=1 Tax=Aspergillus welwitschiae TaxID=1341132 RepID=A0A3F3PUD7_9EURO|nr:hypothetical protein BDQ94DRAFT_149059 [Aspergillus welwitschiae]RDH30438.1 hypothetical protein BDQ94DRAFT_149059 [Aspergillus welwitschiae]